MSIQAQRNWGPIITIGIAIAGAAIVGALMLIRGDDGADDPAQTPPAETR